MVNSRLDLFAATLSRSEEQVFITVAGYLFFRSYEAILQSSLAGVISSTLAFSANPPVAVYGTDILISRSRSFSRQRGVSTFSSVDDPHHASVYNARADLPTLTTYTLEQALPIACVLSLLRPSAASNDIKIVKEYQPFVHRLRLSASS